MASSTLSDALSRAFLNIERMLLSAPMHAHPALSKLSRGQDTFDRPRIIPRTCLRPTTLHLIAFWKTPTPWVRVEQRLVCADKRSKARRVAPSLVTTILVASCLVSSTGAYV